MGTPSDPSDPFYEPGLTCSDCWGPGKTFGDFVPPKFVHAVFSPMIMWCAGGEGPWLLEQLALKPCEWKFDNGLWRVRWLASNDLWGLFLENLVAGRICFLSLQGPCETHFIDGGKTGVVY